MNSQLYVSCMSIDIAIDIGIMCIDVYVCVHTYICTHTHIYMHTHMQHVDIYVYLLVLAAESKDILVAISTPSLQGLVSKYYSPFKGTGVLREIVDSRDG